MSVRIDGRYYYSPCDDCRTEYCYSCLLSKYKQDLNNEIDRRMYAEARIENELIPRIKDEERSYDRWVLTDRSLEWCDTFDFRVNELVEMFEEDFDWSLFDFDGDDITSQVAKLVGKHLKKL
jgi:hypothetical protein